MHLQDSMTRLTAAAAVVATVVAPILQALAVTILLEQQHQQPLVLQLNQENKFLLLLFKSRDITIFDKYILV